MDDRYIPVDPQLLDILNTLIIRYQTSPYELEESVSILSEDDTRRLLGISVIWFAILRDRGIIADGQSSEI